MGVVGTRKIVFENFRNLGIQDPGAEDRTETRLDLGVIGTGGLVCLIGANNEGKSNVLEGIAKLAEGGPLDARDEPHFTGLKSGKPSVLVEYRIKDSEDGSWYSCIEKISREVLPENIQKVFVISEVDPRAENFLKNTSGLDIEAALGRTLKAIYGKNDMGEAIFFRSESGYVFSCKKGVSKTFRCFRIEHGDRSIGRNNIYSWVDGVRVKVSTDYEDVDSGEYGDAYELVEYLEAQCTEELSNFEVLQRNNMRFPKIFFYQERALDHQDLQVAYQEVEQSAFFVARRRHRICCADLRSV